MLIRELAEKTGLAPHTIRFYEKEQLLDERFFERGENNYRYYAETAFERVMMIKQGQAAGFTLSEIRKLMQAWDAGELTSQEQRNYLQQKVEEIAGKIAELERIQSYLTHKLAMLYAEETTPA
ncbi:MAG: MerR family transcriptional regulator [Chitinophagaceae bacterium]|nr:MerR family transcriptional regulator [Anaerolineae bacterium]